MDQLTYIQSKNPAFGVLTGDLVHHNAEEKDWDEVDDDIDSLGFPIHIAVGNHDIENRYFFESKYGKTAYSFLHNNDLFLILDPNLEGWSISGPQIKMVEEALKTHGQISSNIFIFCHQVIWYSNKEPFNQAPVNSFEGKKGKLNFWTKVVPILKIKNKPVYIFAGDVGAGKWVKNLSYFKSDNLHLIASGMGNQVDDNFLFVHVDKEKKVSIEISALRYDRKRLGTIDEHLIANSN